MHGIYGLVRCFPIGMPEGQVLCLCIAWWLGASVAFAVRSYRLYLTVFLIRSTSPLAPRFIRPCFPKIFCFFIMFSSQHILKHPYIMLYKIQICWFHFFTCCWSNIESKLLHKCSIILRDISLFTGQGDPQIWFFFAEKIIPPAEPWKKRAPPLIIRKKMWPPRQRHIR